MSKQRKYNDYHSVWRHKTSEAVKNEIDLIQVAYEAQDKYGHREDLHPSDKLDILFGILNEREKECV